MPTLFYALGLRFHFFREVFIDEWKKVFDNRTR